MVIRGIVALAVAVVLGSTLAACGLTTSGKTDGITAQDEAAAQAAVDSAVIVGGFQQVASPIQRDIFDDIVTLGLRQVGPTPQALEAALELAFDASDEEIEVTRTLVTYTVTFNNMDLYDLGVIVNGSITVTPTVTGTPALTIHTEGFQIGNLTLSVDLTVARSGEEQVTANGTVTGTYGSTTTTVTLTGVTITWGDDQVAFEGQLSVEVVGLGTLVITAADMVLVGDSVYPVSGTLSFSVSGRALSVAFSRSTEGVVTATLTGPGGQTAAVPLPQIEEA